MPACNLVVGFPKTTVKSSGDDSRFDNGLLVEYASKGVISRRGWSVVLNILSLRGGGGGGQSLI